jgi:hypothetical protein
MSSGSWLDEAARMSLDAMRAKFPDVPDVPIIKESPIYQIGTNFVYRKCEHCKHFVASVINAQHIAQDAHRCKRNGSIVFVIWTP